VNFTTSAIVDPDRFLEFAVYRFFIAVIYSIQSDGFERGTVLDRHH
jgi:hypothetical protein